MHSSFVKPVNAGPRMVRSDARERQRASTLLPILDHTSDVSYPRKATWIAVDPEPSWREEVYGNIARSSAAVKVWTGKLHASPAEIRRAAGWPCASIAIRSANGRRLPSRQGSVECSMCQPRTVPYEISQS